MDCLVTSGEEWALATSGLYVYKDAKASNTHDCVVNSWQVYFYQLCVCCAAVSISCMHGHLSDVEQFLSISRQRCREFVVMDLGSMFCIPDQYRLVWSLVIRLSCPGTFFFSHALISTALTAVGWQVRELVKKINGLEEQRDALERRLAAQVQPAPTAGAHESLPAGTGGLPLHDQLLLKVSHRGCNPFFYPSL